jgi:hypothetical protein
MAELQVTDADLLEPQAVIAATRPLSAPELVEAKPVAEGLDAGADDGTGRALRSLP